MGTRFVILVFAILASANCKDILVGSNSTDGTKIYDESIEASPAIWRQIQNVTVQAPENNVISLINVTDLREGKDGDAKIVDGGEGNETVTLELKSPTVLRGFTFHIEIYTIPKSKYGEVKPIDSSEASKLNQPSEGNLRLNIGEDAKLPKAIAQEASTKHPVPLSTEIQVNDGKRLTRETEKAKTSAAKVSEPESGDKQAVQQSLDINKFKILDHKYQPHHADHENHTETLPETAKINVENSTHLPVASSAPSEITAGNHARHARSLRKRRETTFRTPLYSQNHDLYDGHKDGKINLGVKSGADDKDLPPTSNEDEITSKTNHNSDGNDTLENKSLKTASDSKSDDINKAESNKDVSRTATTSPKPKENTSTTEKNRVSRDTENSSDNIALTTPGNATGDTTKTNKGVTPTTTASPKTNKDGTTTKSSTTTTEKPRIARGTEEEKISGLKPNYASDIKDNKAKSKDFEVNHPSPYVPLVPKFNENKPSNDNLNHVQKIPADGKVHVTDLKDVDYPEESNDSISKDSEAAPYVPKLPIAIALQTSTPKSNANTALPKTPVNGAITNFSTDNSDSKSEESKENISQMDMNKLKPVAAKKDSKHVISIE